MFSKITAAFALLLSIAGAQIGQQQCETFTGGRGVTFFTELALGGSAQVGDRILSYFEGVDGIDAVTGGSAECTVYRTDGEKTNVCTTVLQMKNGGTIVGVGDTGGLGSTFAITGGSGDYRGATGDFFVLVDQTTFDFTGSPITANFAMEMTICNTKAV